MLRDVLATLDEAGFDPLLNGDTFAEGFDFFQPGRAPQKSLPGRVSGLEPRLRAGLARLFASPPPGIFAGFAMGTRDEMLAVQRQLRPRCRAGSRPTCCAALAIAASCASWPRRA